MLENIKNSEVVFDIRLTQSSEHDCAHFFSFLLQDVSDVKAGATVLVDRCLLQVANDEYRLHDLVLEYLHTVIKMDEGLEIKASSRQARFLSRIEVLRRYSAGGDRRSSSGPGLYSLVALWTAVKKLDQSLIVEEFYRISLRGVTKIEDVQNAGNLLMRLVSFFTTSLMFRT